MASFKCCLFLRSDPPVQFSGSSLIWLSRRLFSPISSEFFLSMKLQRGTGSISANFRRSSLSLYSTGQKELFFSIWLPLLNTEECFILFSRITSGFEPKTHDFFCEFWMMLLNCRQLMFLVFLSSEDTTVVSTQDFICLESLDPLEIYTLLTLLEFKKDYEGYFSLLPRLRILEVRMVEKVLIGLEYLSYLFCGVSSSFIFFTERVVLRLHSLNSRALVPQFLWILFLFLMNSRQVSSCVKLSILRYLKKSTAKYCLIILMNSPTTRDSAFGLLLLIGRLHSLRVQTWLIHTTASPWSSTLICWCVMRKCPYSLMSSWYVLSNRIECSIFY